MRVQNVLFVGVEHNVAKFTGNKQTNKQTYSVTCSHSALLTSTDMCMYRLSTWTLDAADFIQV